jgi:hypothetical protein
MIFNIITARLGVSVEEDSKEGLAVDRRHLSSQPTPYARLNWEQISLRSEMQDGSGVHL